MQAIREVDVLEDDDLVALQENDLKKIAMQKRDLKVGDRVVHDEFKTSGIWRVGKVEAMDDK